MAYHGGDTVLFHGQMIVLPERTLGVVALANSATAGSVVRKVAAEALKLALEAKTGHRPPEREKSEEGEGSLSIEALQRYEGWYATLVGAVNVRKASGGLRADVMNRTLRLIPRADGSLGLQYRLLGLFPIRIEALDGIGISRTDVAGREILAARVHRRAFPIGERIRPVPLPAEWHGRTWESKSSIRKRMACRESTAAPSGFLFVDFAVPFSSRHGELRDRSRFKVGGDHPRDRARHGRNGPGRHRERRGDDFLLRVSLRKKTE